MDAMHDLMRAHPLALLVTQGPAGLQASPVPFLIYPETGANGTLRAHMARANPHWRDLIDLTECLVVFQGPEGYVTPSWYPGKTETQKVVPTWNYATVHAWGKPSITEDSGWLRRQLNDLTSWHESPRPLPWAIDDAPENYIATQMKAIIGIEIPVTRIEGKWKMSQNKDAADRQGVIDGMHSATDPHHNPPLADLVAHKLHHS